MKKLLALFLLITFITPVFAEEIVTEQEIQNENTYLGVNFEKAPAEPNGKQLIVNHKSFLIINIITNGKIKSKDVTEEQ